MPTPISLLSISYHFKEFYFIQKVDRKSNSIEKEVENKSLLVNV